MRVLDREAVENAHLLRVENPDFTALEIGRRLGLTGSRSGICHKARRLLDAAERTFGDPEILRRTLMRRKQRIGPAAWVMMRMQELKAMTRQDRRSTLRLLMRFLESALKKGFFTEEREATEESEGGSGRRILRKPVGLEKMDENSSGAK